MGSQRIYVVAVIEVGQICNPLHASRDRLAHLEVKLRDLTSYRQELAQRALCDRTGRLLRTGRRLRTGRHLDGNGTLRGVSGVIVVCGSGALLVLWSEYILVSLFELSWSRQFLLWQ